MKPHKKIELSIVAAGNYKDGSVAGIIRSRRKAWTAEELADLLSISKKTVYALAKQGRIPSMRIGSMVRFDPVATADWVEQKAA